VRSGTLTIPLGAGLFGGVLHRILHRSPAAWWFDSGRGLMVRSRHHEMARVTTLAVLPSHARAA
jgi:hypothetical protein